VVKTHPGNVFFLQEIEDAVYFTGICLADGKTQTDFDAGFPTVLDSLQGLAKRAVIEGVRAGI